MPGSPYHVQMRLAAKRLYEANFSIIEISEKKGIPTRTLQNWRKKERWIGGRNQNKRIEAMMLFFAGKSVKMIARLINRPVRTVWTWKLRDNWKVL